MKFGLFVIGAIIAGADAASNIRGVLKDVEPSKEIRELKKNGGGGNNGNNGNQSGNGVGGGEGVADGCPNFMHGWPNGVKNCQAEGNAGCAAPCGGSTSGTCCCVASNGYNFCGNPTSEDCNFSTRCVNDDHSGNNPTPVSQEKLEYPCDGPGRGCNGGVQEQQRGPYDNIQIGDGVDIHDFAGSGVVHSIGEMTGSGGDVVDIQAGDGIDIQVFTDSEGNEVVQIHTTESTANNNNNKNVVTAAHKKIVQDVDGTVGGCFEDVSEDDCASADGTMVDDRCCGAREISVSSGDIPSVDVPSVDIPSVDTPDGIDGIAVPYQATSNGGINNNKNVVAAAHEKVVQHQPEPKAAPKKKTTVNVVSAAHEKVVSSYTTYDMGASSSEKKSVVVDGYELSSIQVASEKTAADCTDDEIFAKLELLVDDEFEDYGQVLLDDDDDDDSQYWNDDEDDFDSGDIGETFIYSECLKRDACYHFSLNGGNYKAFTWGYAKFNVDYRNGHNKRLVCLGSTVDCTATFKIERVTFGCDCNPDNVAYQNAYTGGCTQEELDRAAEDSDDDDSGD